LQDSPSDEAAVALTRPKIVFQEMAWFNRFALDRNGAALTNTAYVVPDTRLAVIAVLNSPLAWWYMWRIAQHGKDEVLRLIGAFMDVFPMPSALSGSTVEAIEIHTTRLIERAEQCQALEKEFADLATVRFGLPSAYSRIVSWLPLPSDSFVARFQKLADVTQTAPKLREEISAFHQKHRARQVELLTAQLGLEEKLAALVEDAYGLTPEERALMRSTRPVRDPLDVLEAKIRGGIEENSVSITEE
jgi:hypothetical protein